MCFGVELACGIAQHVETTRSTFGGRPIALQWAKKVAGRLPLSGRPLLS
jgi:hypothetical protein